MTGLGLVIGAAALACVGGAAVSDVRRFEIPDGWSIAVAALFAAFAFAEWPLPGLWQHAAAGIAMFAAGVALFARGWLGGGDVKLLAAVAVWTGFAGLPWLIAGTTLCGALLAIVALGARRLAPPSPRYPGLQPDGPLPYAVAILGGASMFAVFAT